jgi:hypothetical protein
MLDLSSAINRRNGYMRLGSVSQSNEELKRLRLAYDRAWKQWSVAVTKWQSIHGTTRHGISVADEEIAERLAYSQYQQARNALADLLLSRACIRYLARPVSIGEVSEGSSLSLRSL